MESRWNDDDANRIGADPVSLRVYTSRLLGRDSSLVLHGGGNTSVKTKARDLFSREHDTLFVKGSGWDLATIEPQGFAPVRLDDLRALAKRPTLSDAELMRAQRAALLDPGAPDPSIEAVLHAIIPFAYVDHTHADAVVAITNTPRGNDTAHEVFGPRLPLVPYVMPGFQLARVVREMTEVLDWNSCDGLVLMNHGIFTWAETARESYERMIAAVSRAEEHLAAHGAFRAIERGECRDEDLVGLARIRRTVSRAAGRSMIARLNRSAEACGFASRGDVGDIASRGPVTPDHIIRTKRVPVMFGDDPSRAVESFVEEYHSYFRRHANPSVTMLDAAPRWATWPGQGMISFGSTAGDADVVGDIATHTISVIQWAEALGGWRALPESDLFAVEYWELEQAKLGKRGTGRPLDGRVAFVTGAASGIGRAVAQELATQGASVLGADVKDAPAEDRMALVRCDVTDSTSVAGAVSETIRRFGGLDILVSNAGTFPRSARLDEMDDALWDSAMDVNLTSHRHVLQACIPYLRQGIEPSVVVVGSRNVPAPGPGQAAYSASKAGLTQLARVAALELAGDGIRVNVVHPHAVFDTGVWTPEVIAERAAAYGMSVDEYKQNNLLRVQISATDVALTVAALVGPAFRCTTGAQIPIDGGNDRVI
jgi:rhamnose utilization protein RhaD (predicted bifunctional aldolase and dehydrogenase)/NAD(P)-dependent dehydrogenase (short-subunit alcohol dehydrogenase family)